ncbi:transposable element Tcb2 transposase [Trichonephila clavipes]|nr:transposable element Tcb2 transposase [Trichonephila clavipes]
MMCVKSIESRSSHVGVVRKIGAGEPSFCPYGCALTLRGSSILECKAVIVNTIIFTNYDGTVLIRRIVNDESRFYLSSDDSRVRAWRPRGERLNPAFALQRHTTPIAGAMIWGAMPTILDTPSIDTWHHDSPVPHTARVSQECLRFDSSLTWPARSPDLSPIEHIRDPFGWPVGHSKSLNELESSVSEKILATSASILCLKSERSAGSGESYTQSFKNPTDKSCMVSDRVTVEAM